MALNTGNGKKSSRNYTLCRVCNTKGVKGSPMVTCFKCTKQVHSKNSCATIFDSNNMQYICVLCKVAQRRSNQQNSSINERRSASQAVTPPTTTSTQLSRRISGRDLQAQKTNSTTVLPVPQITDHDTVSPEFNVLTTSIRNFEAQLGEINKLVKELETKCNINLSEILKLKKEN